MYSGSSQKHIQKDCKDLEGIVIFTIAQMQF